MNKKEFLNSNTRDNISVGVAIAFMLCGLIGMHYSDWTTLVLLLPLAWAAIGLLLDWLINGHGTRESIGNAICCALILLNLSTILAHRDTLFIVGRILCSLGLTVMIIRSTKNCDDIMNKELEKKDKLIESIRNDLNHVL